jgi:hypothetical protein
VELLAAVEQGAADLVARQAIRAREVAARRAADLKAELRAVATVLAAAGPAAAARVVPAAAVLEEGQAVVSVAAEVAAEWGRALSRSVSSQQRMSIMMASSPKKNGILRSETGLISGTSKRPVRWRNRISQLA